MVLVEDESRVEFEAKQDRIWAKQGDYPKIELTGERLGHCFYGASDIFSGEHLVKESARLDSSHTVEFLTKVKRNYQPRMKPKRKVLIIWDGAPHHRGEVRLFLKENCNWLELMYFPAYSPELNPEEWMWKEAKGEVCHNHEEREFSNLVYKFYQYLITHQLKPLFCQKVLGI